MVCGLLFRGNGLFVCARQGAFTAPLVARAVAHVHGDVEVEALDRAVHPAPPNPREAGAGPGREVDH